MSALDSTHVDPFHGYAPDGALVVVDAFVADQQIAHVLTYARHHVEVYIAAARRGHVSQVQRAERARRLCEQLDQAAQYWQIGTGFQHLLIVADCIGLRRLLGRMAFAVDLPGSELGAQHLRRGVSALVSAETIISAQAVAGWCGVEL